MPFVKRLTRIGDSIGLIIDRPFLRQLELAADSEVEVAVENNALVVTAHRYVSDEKFAASVRRVRAKHAKALAGLAKR
jgi:antitoxin component of MazEF toxin-antitoxin module